MRAARELGREPELPAPPLRAARRLRGAARGIAPAGAGGPPGAERVGRAAAAPYGDAALRSGRPYAAWIGTSLDEEWAARRPHLRPSRRLALELNAPLLRQPRAPCPPRRDAGLRNQPERRGTVSRRQRASSRRRSRSCRSRSTPTLFAPGPEMERLADGRVRRPRRRSAQERARCCSRRGRRSGRSSRARRSASSAALPPARCRRASRQRARSRRSRTSCAGRRSSSSRRSRRASGSSSPRRSPRGCPSS